MRLFKEIAKWIIRMIILPFVLSFFIILTVGNTGFWACGTKWMIEGNELNFLWTKKFWKEYFTIKIREDKNV